MIHDGQLLNYIGGTWKRSHSGEYLDVRNPATSEAIVRVPLSSPEEVDEAVKASQAAFIDWRQTPSVGGYFPDQEWRPLFPGHRPGRPDHRPAESEGLPADQPGAPD